MTDRPALLDALIRRIRLTGPITVSDYMAEALADPRAGYYATRDPFGAAGDFVTAPEISQMFGELIGLWCVQVWRDMGAPACAALIELGPGRGTLMDDALRAARLDPAFIGACRLHLVEASPVLQARQRRRLEPHGVRPVWHDTVARALAAADGPLLVIANEFFDALPVRQFVRERSGWHERMVALDESGGLAFRLAPDAIAPAALDHPCAKSAPVGALVEIAPARDAAAASIAFALAARGGAALIVDYGHRHSAPGDTLQAVKAHRPHGVLDDPGAADITAHVDFAAIARAARRSGAIVYGPIGQGDFLNRLGIGPRARALAAAAPARTADIEAGLTRLTAPDQMGTLFKALALTRPGAPPPPAFEGEDRGEPA